MDPATWGFVGTIFGVIVGAGASVLTTMITGENERRLQAESDSLLRLERGREFQRTNLLDLQECMLGYMRFVGQAHMEHVRSFHENPVQKLQPLLSDTLDQDLSKGNRRLALLIERVRDDDLRERLKRMREPIFAMLVSRTGPESAAHFDDAMKSFDGTMESVGAALRSYY